MIDPKRLLNDLQRLVKRLEDDLRERATSVIEMEDRLKEGYQSAKDAGRTGESFEAWREGMLTQAAVAWILGCVFVRFMEDNSLVDEALISGPGERRGGATDRQTLYFQSRPTDTDRDYLYDVFNTVAQLPAVIKLYDKAHNPLWSYGISGDAAKELIAFLRQVIPETGELVHDFTDVNWNTRFLGDLYQDLSEAARKRYALLQTPEFVEEFILDRTLNPAIEEFGLKEVRLIDPTCGSGHFLLGAFARLLNKWFKKEPGTPERELVQRALNGVYGVDINPYAAAIARFRLLVEALKANGIRRIKEAPGYRINVTAGDSLLHGPRLLTAADSVARHGARSGELELGSAADQLRTQPGIGHAFDAEDLDELNRVLGQRYHAVVGNPPYITVKDKALNQLYRGRYITCHRQYSLAVPFMERFFQLAFPVDSQGQDAGYVGMITANSFMKREFGKKLVEAFLHGVDLTHVIDTSGAYIPGHGTPTVILFGRERAPVTSTVRTVMGIKGEPSTPDDPAKGVVWSAIAEQVDRAGSESEWISVANTPRTAFAKHPWSIGGGGAAELREFLDDAGSCFLGDIASDIGFGAVTREDEAYIVTTPVAVRQGITSNQVLPMVSGDGLRDWAAMDTPGALWPYDPGNLDAKGSETLERFLWFCRTQLSSRVAYGLTQLERGLQWFEYSMFFKERYRTQLSIAFAEVSTHNHFMFDRGGKVFNRTAPVIKLPIDATEADHLALLGLLNSSTACFWLKQVCHNKGSTVDAHGARQTTDAFENFFQFNVTKVKKFPIPYAKPLDRASKIQHLAQHRLTHLLELLVEKLPLSRNELNVHRTEAEQDLCQMISLQEELDWCCYSLYGITDQELCHLDPPEITLGQRAFEIVMARQMAKGNLETTWFERHRSKPITDFPDHWPEDYRELVERRISLIESDRYVGLIERSEFKRRWNQETWGDQEQRALSGWLLARLEQECYWSEPRLLSVRFLAERAETDAGFMSVAELYVGHSGFDVLALVTELVESESVPFLRALRYKPSGLRKREVWEKTWDLQRQEDAIDARVAAELTQVSDETDEEYQIRLEKEQRKRKKVEVGDIASPPKYRSPDYISSGYWRLRGALDVPKERFLSYPHCSRENDPSLAVGWAGWDHLQQAQALAGYYTEMVEQEGWPAERLTPLLAGLAELLPWLKQWHNDIDPSFNERMGDFFETFLGSELQKHGLTRQDLAAWAPPATATRRGRRRA